MNEAEAVIDIIRAKTDLSMKSAVMQSQGKVSNEINNLREKLLEVIAHIEATVDYPEEDMEQATSHNVSIKLKQIIEALEKILKNAEQGKIIRDGLNTVIVGKPNVGKSSLLNALLSENRAIVTDIPGTTRDVIEEFINIDGIPIKIVDTAGIRKSNDLVEKIGVEKSIEKINEADLVILMLDLSREIDEEDKKSIIILNKKDLKQKLNLDEISGFKSEYIIKISASSGEGIDNLKQGIKDLFFNGKIESKDILITNARHKEAVFKAKESCLSALKALKDTDAIDLASIDIRNAWLSLGEITGDTLEENIIDKIFSKFCLGK